LAENAAILFLYRDVLRQQLEWLDDGVRAKHTVRLPIVLTREQMQAVLSSMRGVAWIQASLIYGAGPRLMECARLRVKDIDFDQRRITVREGKGGKDRVTVLPDKVANAGPSRALCPTLTHEKPLGRILTATR